MILDKTRLLNQQLVNPTFRKPKDLVAWMGAMQAQEYAMMKWAVGIRLKSATLQTVDKALERGEILRTHIMRPTWHLVVAEDIRWMLKLSAERIKSAFDSYAKGNGMEFSTSQITQSYDLLEKILSGNNSLTKQEISEELLRNNLCVNDHRVTYLLTRAEQDGIVCSGPDKAKKPTYALFEERVPAAKDITKDEALARLAQNYFRSHAPATLQDFVWWSGLTVNDAKQAIYLIETQLIKEQLNDQTFFIHESSRTRTRVTDSFLLLPSYDEYLISYKQRTHVLPLEHHPKAFSNNGLFYPVLLANGQVVGNWKKSVKRGQLCIEPVFWEETSVVDPSLIAAAQHQYETFINPQNK